MGPKKKRQSNKTSAIMRPVYPDSLLANIINSGTGGLPRSQIVKKLWTYIKRHNLQVPDNGRFIVLDDNLARLYGQRKGHQVSAFGTLAKVIQSHLR